MTSQLPRALPWRRRTTVAGRWMRRAAAAASSRWAGSRSWTGRDGATGPETGCRGSGPCTSAHASNLAYVCWHSTKLTSRAGLWNLGPCFELDLISARDCRVPNLLLCTKYQNRMIFLLRWRLNDLQYGGRPPSWVSEIQSSCHATSMAMPFCFPAQNFIDIGHLLLNYGKKNDF